MSEVWKDIPGWEGLYQASSEGQIRAMASRRGVKPGQILTGFLVKECRYIRLRKGNEKRLFLIDRLILETFAPHPDSVHLVAVHDNGRPDDNRLKNLCWCSHDEALTRQRWQYCQGEAVASAKLSVEAVREMRRLYAANHSQTDIASSFGVSQGTVSRVVRGETWRHVA